MWGVEGPLGMEMQSSSRPSRPSRPDSSSDSSSPRPSVVLVTGASSGIGFAVASAYTRLGSPVVINARDGGKLAAAAERLGAAERVVAVTGDVGEIDTGPRMVAAAVERFGRVDVLVNNAGVFRVRRFADHRASDFEDVFRTNLLGAFLVSQAFVRQVREQGGGGAIVNVSASIALQGQASVPGSASIASKGGLIALTRALALELAPDRIRVNAVAPGTIRTPLLGPLEHAVDRLAGAQPIGRVGEPHEIADAVLYLAAAEFTTGAILAVDGGTTAGRW
jgi:NAD(P)-dependent dehydrogenase (short-subunit alcohol dehydrogenase family)